MVKNKHITPLDFMQCCVQLFIMKNWNRIVKLKDADVVVQRYYDSVEDETAPYKLDIIVNVDGALNKASMGYSTEEKQINAYESITDEQVQVMFESVMDFH